MTRDDALLSRLAESAAQESKDSGEGDATTEVREGITSSLDPSELREVGAGEATEHHAEADREWAAYDPLVNGPPDVRDHVDVDVAAGAAVPDRGTFTTHTGDMIGASGGGGRLADSVESRADELGGASLDRGFGSVDDPFALPGRSAGPGTGFGARDGSQVSSGEGSGADDSLSTLNEMRGAQGLPDITADPSGDGSTPDGEGYYGYGEDGTWQRVDDTGDPGDTSGGYWGYGEDGTWQQIDETTGDPPADDGGYYRPDPTGGDAILTGDAARITVQARQGGGLINPGENDEATDTGAAVARAAMANNPDKVTNYGPEGEQTVEVGANWAPPPDTIFDPPPDASAMGDASTAVGGSMVGSTGETDFPPPPDPPPGGDDGGGGGPMGPPGGDGGEG
jgi:hypothetical protein